MEFMYIIGLIILGLYIKTYLPKYIEEKAKNLATKEDVGEITSKIEKVKREYDVLYSAIKNS